MSEPTGPSTPKRKSILKTSDSPNGPSSPSSQHTYTSLAAVRKANKNKQSDTPERDRKNGWHLWSLEEAERTQPASDVERGSSSAGPAHGGEKKKKPRLTQWNMVGPPSLLQFRYVNVLWSARSVGLSCTHSLGAVP